MNDRNQQRCSSIRIRVALGRCLALLTLYLAPHEAWSMQCEAAARQLEMYAQQVVATYHYQAQPIQQGCMQQCYGNTWCQQQCEITYGAPLINWYTNQMGQIQYWAQEISLSCLGGGTGGRVPDIESDPDDADTVERGMRKLKRAVRKEGRDVDVDIDIPDKPDW